MNIKSRLPNLLEWLERESPDVACLQELKALDSAFPRQAVYEAGYFAIFKGQRSWNGVAILSKIEPVEIRRELPGDRADDHSRYLEAAIDGIIVACLPVPATQRRSAHRPSAAEQRSFKSAGRCQCGPLGEGAGPCQ